MYVLYGGAFTRALITEMVLAEGGLDYELRKVDIAAGEHRTPEYLAVNPAGGVPALVTPEGVMLHETPAINLYLAERHDLTHIAPQFDEPERGPFLDGLFYLAGEIEPAMKRYFYPDRFAVRRQDAAAVKARALDMALERLAVIDRRLSEGGPYYIGESFSLVDLTMAYWVTYIADATASLAAVTRCCELVMERPLLNRHFAVLAEECETAAARRAKEQDRKDLRHGET